MACRFSLQPDSSDASSLSLFLAPLQPLPPITCSTLFQNIQWVSFLALTVTPSIAIYGICTTDWQLKTAVWSLVYYFMTGLGITAGESHCTSFVPTACARCSR